MRVYVSVYMYLCLGVNMHVQVRVCTRCVSLHICTAHTTYIHIRVSVLACNFVDTLYYFIYSAIEQNVLGSPAGQAPG